MGSAAHGCCRAGQVLPKTTNLPMHHCQIASVRRLFEEGREAPPVTRNQPPLAGSIRWSRGLLARLRRTWLRLQVRMCEGWRMDHQRTSGATHMCCLACLPRSSGMHASGYPAARLSPLQALNAELESLEPGKRAAAALTGGFEGCDGGRERSQRFCRRGPAFTQWLAWWLSDCRCPPMPALCAPVRSVQGHAALRKNAVCGLVRHR